MRPLGSVPLAMLLAWAALLPSSRAEEGGPSPREEPAPRAGAEEAGAEDRDDAREELDRRWGALDSSYVGERGSISEEMASRLREAGAEVPPEALEARLRESFAETGSLRGALAAAGAELGLDMEESAALLQGRFHAADAREARALAESINGPRERFEGTDREYMAAVRGPAVESHPFREAKAAVESRVPGSGSASVDAKGARPRPGSAPPGFHPLGQGRPAGGAEARRPPASSPAQVPSPVTGPDGKRITGTEKQVQQLRVLLVGFQLRAEGKLSMSEARGTRMLDGVKVEKDGSDILFKSAHPKYRVSVRIGPDGVARPLTP